MYKMNPISKCCFVVIWSLAMMVACVYGITIDGQLTVIKNDCYERMAIGEKISPKQTYKTFDHNTVLKCEMECTQEKETCRAFSFGIGPKGNATCLLSKNPVRETADRKPIGTISDTDYDLYTKKLDCQVVLEPPHFQGPHGPAENPSHAEEIHHGQSQQVVQEHYNGQNQHHVANGNLPQQSNYFNFVSTPDKGSEYGYQYNKPNNQLSTPVQSQNHNHGNDLHHVQTLVSIASGPQSVLHPVHDILVSGDAYGQGKPQLSSGSTGYGNQHGNMPPFRPPALNNPYDGLGPGRPPQRPLAEDYERPDKPYSTYGNSKPYLPRPGYNHEGHEHFTILDNRPGLPHPNDFDRPYRPERPLYGYQPNNDRPDPEYGSRPPLVDTGYGSGGQVSIDRRKYESSSQFNSFASDTVRYGPERYPLNYNFYDHYDKPNQNHPNRYGSVIPHPNDYTRPDPHYDYLFVRPNSDPYKDQMPHLRPLRPEHDHQKPTDESGFINQGYGRPDRPLSDPYRPNFSDANYGGTRPQNEGDMITEYNMPIRPPSDDNKRRPTPLDQQDSPRPTQRPIDLSTSSSRPPSTELSNHYGGVDYTNKQYGKPGEYLNFKEDGGTRKIVSQSVGYDGEKITSIITELQNACFRRTLAGKRVVRGLVRKLLICDTVEQCQRECGDEKLFTCEGFNYRLDPTGRGKGDCELLDLPLLKIDIRREVVTDPDYDYYTRDRNAGQVNCRQPPSNSYLPDGGYRGGGQRYGDGYGYEGNEGYRRGDIPRPFDRRPTDIAVPLRRPGERWDGNYGDRGSRPPLIDQRPLLEDDRRYDYGNRRGDNSFHHSHESQSSHSHSYHYNEHNVDRYDHHQHEENRPYTGIHYLPASNDQIPNHDNHLRPYDRYTPPNGYPVIISLDDNYHHNPLPSDSRYPVDRYSSDRYPAERYPSDRRPEKDYWGLSRNRWGSYGGYYGNSGYSDSYYGHGAQQNRYRYENNRHNNYIPSSLPRPEPPNDWGLYGGSYGNGGLSLEYQGYGNNKQNYNYWGLNTIRDGSRPSLYGPELLPPRKSGSYLPIEKPLIDKSYLPLPRPNGGYHYGPPKQPGLYEIDNSILPVEPRKPPSYNGVRDECSLRSATGFRLHKGIVKKFFSVSNIYECELLCVREKDFPCASYAYRYTLIFGPPAENCYLSNRNYKELDYYTDLEPDRDFDIYTMNNRNQCEEPIIYLEKKDSDCFWRVRSGQRLDHSVVRDSLTVKSTVDCQLECLQARRFTCRAYSFRYGSPVIGGAIDNCQLTDWPFFELDPRTHFIPEPGFEVYERGSYGHGCEPDHFGIRGKHIRNNGIKVDQLCYVGFGSAAKLLPQATIKSLYVPTELDCKVECSKAREGILFRCMSFSFTTEGPKVGHNCFLSDIMQRDLLPNVDYIHDPESWLFAWDNYNPECLELANKPLHNGPPISQIEKYGPPSTNGLDVWRVYSVSGWPCRRGTTCRENKIAGFWYCDLEGADKSAWDYCCSPDHHCGFSNGYSYSWCYVGPTKTQWRKCNDQYYPYIHNVIDRLDGNRKPWQSSGPLSPPPQTLGYRPDRPNAPPKPVPSSPSLNEYEQEFDNEFLSPPKPGGFGQPRRWPVAYLHKEMPPNNTDTSTDAETRSVRTQKKENSKLSAIKNLIDVIKSNDFKHVQYHIANDSNKPDDILYVKIPLPNLHNKSEGTISPEKSEKSNELSSNTQVKFEVVDTAKEQSARVQKSLPLESQTSNKGTNDWPYSVENFTRSPAFRRGFVTRTNLTSIRNYNREEFRS